MIPQSGIAKTTASIGGQFHKPLYNQRRQSTSPTHRIDNWARASKRKKQILSSRRKWGKAHEWLVRGPSSRCIQGGSGWRATPRLRNVPRLPRLSRAPRLPQLGSVSRLYRLSSVARLLRGGARPYLCVEAHLMTGDLYCFKLLQLGFVASQVQCGL